MKIPKIAENSIKKIREKLFTSVAFRKLVPWLLAVFRNPVMTAQVAFVKISRIRKYFIGAVNKKYFDISVLTK